MNRYERYIYLEAPAPIPAIPVTYEELVTNRAREKKCRVDGHILARLQEAIPDPVTATYTTSDLNWGWNVSYDNEPI